MLKFRSLCYSLYGALAAQIFLGCRLTAARHLLVSNHNPDSQQSSDVVIDRFSRDASNDRKDDCIGKPRAYFYDVGTPPRNCSFSPSKTVIEVRNSDNGTQAVRGFKVANLILENEPTAEVIMTFHSDSLWVLLAPGSQLPNGKGILSSADAVSDMLEKGVQVQACHNTMERHGYKPEDLLPGVTIINSAAYEISSLQSRFGFGHSLPYSSAVGA